MKVAKWGDSLAVRLPAQVVQALGLKEGDEIEIHVAGARDFGVRAEAKPRGFFESAARLPRSAAAGLQIRPGRGECPANFFDTNIALSLSSDV